MLKINEISDWKQAINNIVLGDALYLLRKLPDKCMDLAIVDPPYFSGPEKREFYGQKESSIGVNKLYQKSAAWELVTIDYWNELQRVAKNYIFWGCNYYNFPFHTGRIVWDKVNDSSDYSDCEIAATNLIDHVRIFRYMWNGMLQGKSITQGTVMQGNKKLNEKRIHPTQKPVALYKWLLINFAKAGWLILDTHFGSGSHGIACHDLGFNLIACDNDPHWVSEATKRIEEHKAQQSLFTAAEIGRQRLAAVPLLTI